MAAAGPRAGRVRGRPRTGLRAIIAIHSTALGPALGGVRFWQYAQRTRPRASTRCACREAMTFKAAAPGLTRVAARPSCCSIPTGRARGAAARAGPGDRRARRPLHRGRGRRRDAAGHELDRGRPRGSPASTSPTAAPATRRRSPRSGSCRHARRRCASSHGDPSAAGRRVAVQGSGHVGAHLVRLLVAAGARGRRRRPPTRTAGPRSQRELGVAVRRIDEVAVRASATSVAVRARRRVRRPRRSRGCAAARSPAPPTTSSARSTTATRSRHAASSTRPTSSSTPAASSTSPASSAATTPSASASARAAIEQTVGRVFALARERGISPARAAERWPASASPRWHRSPPLAARRSRRPGPRAAALERLRGRDPAAGQRRRPCGGPS